MSIFSLILKEMTHRKINFLLSLLGVVTAVAFFVSFSTSGPAAKKETARIQRDLGLNLRIIAKETDMNDFWSTGYSDQTLPEEAVYRFSTQTGVSYTHLLATLQKKVSWRESTVLLTGLASEVSTADKKKKTMSYEIDPGKVFVGHQVAQGENIKREDKVEILGKEMIVEKALSETGTEDDIRVYAHLHEVQEMLDMKGQVNEIKALNCWCSNPEVDELAVLRSELSKIIPEGQVIQMKAMAEARDKQRLMVEQYFSLVMPFVVVICAIWIATLAMINTRERRNEIGVLRALGYESGKIATLFLGKSLVIGVIGAVVGFAIGTWFALEFGPQVFKVTARFIKAEYTLLWYSLVAAPLFAALSSFIPAMIAVTDDPAVSLREE